MSRFLENQGTSSLPAAEWWRRSFSEEEKNTIRELFQPMGAVSMESIVFSDDPNTLATLAAYLKREPIRHLGYRLLDRADMLVSEQTRPSSLHFFFAVRGDFYYRWRDIDPDALEEAAESYRRQISLAPSIMEDMVMDIDGVQRLPAHAGYRQLRVLEEKRGNYPLARALCVKAKEQGWADDWDKQIARLDKKIAKESL